MLKRFGLTFLLTILGAILGLGLAIAFVWDWFSSDWAQLEASPEPIAELLHIERDQVWVESETGIFYEYNPVGSCEADCWTIVEGIPEAVYSDDADHFDVKNTTCSPALPLLNIEEKIEQCHVEMWANRNYVFALRENGSVYFWQGDVYGEWLVIELFLGICGGAFFLFVPALLFIFLPGLIKWLAKPKNKKKRAGDEKLLVFFLYSLS